MNLKSIKLIGFLLLSAILISGCSNDQETPLMDTPLDVLSDIANETAIEEETDDTSAVSSQKLDKNFDYSKYTDVPAESCSINGGRISNAKVDIGYDSSYATRDYYGYTNEYGQLFHVEANEIILQDDNQEIPGDDRYCNDEAKVPGTEQSDLDEGHVIADSLGGVSNSYNITPQESQLNRHGMQADIEAEIRDAGGATNFIADIEYPNNQTQIPSSYTLSYTVYGQNQSHTFGNEYSDDSSSSFVTNSGGENNNNATTNDYNSSVYYKNCTAVRDAGAAPIYTGDPGYDSHLDRDGDGIACE